MEITLEELEDQMRESVKRFIEENLDADKYTNFTMIVGIDNPGKLLNYYLQQEVLKRIKENSKLLNLKYWGAPTFECSIIIDGRDIYIYIYTNDKKENKSKSKKIKKLFKADEIDYIELMDEDQEAPFYSLRFYTEKERERKMKDKEIIVIA